MNPRAGLGYECQKPVNICGWPITREHLTPSHQGSPSGLLCVPGGFQTLQRTSCLDALRSAVSRASSHHPAAVSQRLQQLGLRHERFGSDLCSGTHGRFPFGTGRKIIVRLDKCCYRRRAPGSRARHRCISSVVRYRDESSDVEWCPLRYDIACAPRRVLTHDLTGYRLVLPQQCIGPMY